MTCNICGLNEATVHLTEITNNKMHEIHLCEECAQEKGTSFKTHFNAGEVFAGLGDFVGQVKKNQGVETRECEGCKIRYEEFAKNGRLGCEKCYESFSNLLLPLIKRVQRSTEHIGKGLGKKKRASAKPASTMTVLKNKLKQAVKDEDFEEAAKVRDKIKKMEEKKTDKTKL